MAGSERESLGSKLKESKMSAVSFSAYFEAGNDASTHKLKQHTLHKFKSDPEFISFEDAQRLLLQ